MALHWVCDKCGATVEATGNLSSTGESAPFGWECEYLSGPGEVLLCGDCLKHVKQVRATFRDDCDKALASWLASR